MRKASTPLLKSGCIVCGKPTNSSVTSTPCPLVSLLISATGSDVAAFTGIAPQLFASFSLSALMSTAYTSNAPKARANCTADMPSPVETVNGMGLCAVSRVLRHAQFQRDVSIRDRERSSGVDPKTLHMVSGVTRKELQETLTGHKEHQEEQGYTRFAKPVIMSVVDPTKAVSAESIDLAPKPEDWDTDIVMKWYITLLAMATASLPCSRENIKKPKPG